MSDGFDFTPEAPSDGRRVSSVTRRATRQQTTAVTADKQTRTPKSVKAGEYERQTITLPPAQRTYIKELAQKLGVSMFDLYRWLIDRGLQAYEAGERPETAEVKRTGVITEHWTSS